MAVEIAMNGMVGGAHAWYGTNKKFGGSAWLLSRADCAIVWGRCDSVLPVAEPRQIFIWKEISEVK